MPGISVSKIPIPFKRAGISWSSYWEKQLTVTPNVYVGVTIAADYALTYIEGTTTYQWYRADDSIGTNETAITGAVSRRYTVTHDDNGKYLSVLVTPRTTDEVAREAVKSPFVEVTSIKDYSDCALWLRGDDAETDANGIYRIPDHSGTNNHALQNTDGLKPQKVANSLNGRAIINSDGTDDYMSLTYLLSLTDFTIFIVNDNKYVSSTILGHNTNSNMYVNTQNAVTRYRANTLISTDHTNFLTYPAINTLRRASGTLTSRRNGVNTASSPAVLTTTLTLNQLFRRAASFVYTSGVGEIIVFSRALSDTEISEVEAILNHRYDAYPDAEAEVYVPELPQEVSSTYVDYKYYGLNRLNISAVKENYAFAHRRHPVDADARHAIYYSNNGGVSFKPSALTVDNDIEVAFLFDNGNVIFGTKDALYYSTDSLESKSVISVKNTDGSTYTPSVTGNNYRPLSYPAEFNIGGSKAFLWGNYSNVSEGNSEINIWKATSDGNVESLYKFGQNAGYGSFGDALNPIICRHVHHVFYEEGTGVVYVTTGDGAYLTTRECHILVGHIDGTSGKIMIDSDYNSNAAGYYKNTGILASGDYLYVIEDCTSTPANNGIFRFLKTDIDTPANWIKLYNTTYPMVGNIMPDGKVISNLINNQIIVDDTFGASAQVETISVLDNTYSIYPTTMKNKEGYYLLKPWKNADDGNAQFRWGAILLKIK